MIWGIGAKVYKRRLSEEFFVNKRLFLYPYRGYVFCQKL